MRERRREKSNRGALRGAAGLEQQGDESAGPTEGACSWQKGGSRKRGSCGHPFLPAGRQPQHRKAVKQRVPSAASVSNASVPEALVRCSSATGGRTKAAR